MKICTCFLVLSLLLSNTPISFSQVSLGLQGQINNMSTPLVIKRDLLSKALGEALNPGAGIFVEYNVNKYWALQLEFNYQEQRKSFLLTGNDRSINTSIMEYLRIPILAKCRFPFQKWSLTAILGPTPGYGLALKSGKTDQNLNFTEYEKLSFSENAIKRFDLGMLAGVGVEKVLANNLKTKLSLRYYLGFVDIMKDEFSTFYNRGYALDIGFIVPFSIFKKKEKKEQD